MTREPERVQEIEPGQLWLPESFEEWADRERIRTFLPAWSAQADHERRLRERCAWMIFALSAVQTLGGFGLLVAIGLQALQIDGGLLKLIFSALLAEIFGLFYVLARYLFSRPLALNLSAMMDGQDGRRPQRRDQRSLRRSAEPTTPAARV